MKILPLLVGLLLISCIQIKGQDGRVNLAYQYFRDQDYTRAAPIFQELYQSNKAPHYLQYWVRCLIETGQHETALRELKKVQRDTRDITLNIEIGYVYEQQGDMTEAIRYYELPFKNLPANPGIIRNLGNDYASYLKYQYAQMVYLTGRALLGNPDEFRVDLGNLYATQRKYPEMLEEYFNLLITDPGYSVTIQPMLNNSRRTDIDGDLMSLIKEKTYQYIQMLPGAPVFVEMLIWVLSEEGHFMEAVDQAIALDKRLREPGERLLTLGRTSRQSGDYEASLKAYQYLLDKPKQTRGVQADQGMSFSVPIERQAGIEFLLTRAEYLNQQTPVDRQLYIDLQQDFRKKIEELGMSPDAAQLLIPLARIEAYHLDDQETAVNTLDSGIETPGIPRPLTLRYLLEKGDILLATSDPWEALFMYARVEKENPDSPEGSEAKLKKARLSYLTGEYQWALTQLNVLKGSTSRPVANDAMELALFIRNNLDPADSTNFQIKEIARCDYLILRHRYEEALTILDSILVSSPNHPIADETLYRKANILQTLSRYDEAAILLEEVVNRFPYEYLAPKALFELGNLYDLRMNDPVKATQYFQRILRAHPTSLYFLDARNRLRELRSGDASTPSNP